MKIIAADDPVYSFIQKGSDKYHFNSENKSRFTGGDIEIIRKILDNLKIPYDFHIVPFYKIESMLIHGEADLALGVVKTKKSLEYADFPKTPMRTQNYVFFGRKKDSKGPTMSFETILMHNFNVGISAYVRYPENFWKMFPYEGKILNNHLVEYNSYEKSIADLKSKKIDVFIGNKDLVNSILARTKNTDIIFQYKNILYWKDFYCAFSKSSPLKNKDEIKLKFQKSLYKMKESNELKEITEHWIEKNQ